MTDATISSANPDLQSLHETLIQKVADLSAQLGSATSTTEARAIMTEIDEFNHRVTLVGNLLFKQQTAQITKAASKVNDAIPDLDAAIANAAAAADFVKGVTAFLALVDKVIDTAKLVLP
jgi:hypothetical protein